LAFCPRVSAHRLDEYLQATRISVGTHRVDLEIDLTPGVSIAGTIVWLIDRNKDGLISPEEGAAYAASALKTMAIDIDGKPQSLGLIDSRYPTVEEMKSGQGVIRLRAHSQRPWALPGVHRVHYRNDHQPGLSVYLVNAVVPTSDRIEILAQSRDVSQRDYRLDFRESIPMWAKAATGLGALAALVTGVRWIYHYCRRKKMPRHGVDITDGMTPAPKRAGVPR
jgi:hypothetical protein